MSMEEVDNALNTLNTILNMLNQEEIEALRKSPVCLNCNHREILHNSDYEFGILCNICECEEVIKEGDYSNWSIERSKWNAISNTANNPLEDRLYKLLETMSLDKFSQERELPEEVEGKIIRIKRYNRIKLPE